MFRRGHGPQKRSCSSLLPYPAYDNETFDHLLPVVDDALEMVASAAQSRRARVLTL